MLWLGGLLVLAATAFPGYEERYYNQTLDHFRPESHGSHARWQQRYLYNDSHWTGRGELPNGCRGPILVYTGNEGPIDGFWPGNGFMIETLAPKWGALLVFPEERSALLTSGNTSSSSTLRTPSSYPYYYALSRSPSTPRPPSFFTSFPTGPFPISHPCHAYSTPTL
jgi:hypothetical protein